MAQERGALHADLPAVPLHLPLDRQDRRRQQPRGPAVASASSEAGVTVFIQPQLMLVCDLQRPIIRR